MLSLSYTAPLVSNGYDILSTEITDGDYSPHWQG